MVKACDHLIKIGNSSVRLTGAQQVALDYLKTVRKTNAVTFNRIRNELETHQEKGCSFDKGGIFEHHPDCENDDLSCDQVRQLFQLGMAEIQPAVRHAMWAFLNMSLKDPVVDYKLVMTKAGREERFGKQGRKNRGKNTKKQDSPEDLQQ